MIITQFKGRIGNQLFQYAAAKKFAIDGETDLKFDMSNYERGPGYVLDYFHIPQNIATEKEINKFKGKKLSSYFDKFLPHYKRKLVHERNGRFDKKLVGLKRKDMYVRGYFQSEKYFKPIENIIRQEFKLKKIDEEKLSPFLSPIHKSNSVSLHIRRTDFLSDKHKKIYEQIQLDYYDKAIGKIGETNNKLNLFIFSDDIEWVKENLKIPPGIQTYFVSGNGLADLEEFFLMSQCRHNITANSTFSWWAAWLNEYPNKIVITPKKWFVEENMGEADLIPPEWIKI